MLHVDRAAGKTAKSAIGVEKELVRTIILQGLLSLGHNGFSRFDRVGPWIHHPQSQLPVCQFPPDHIDVTGAWGGIFKHELIDVHRYQGRQQPGIISGQQYLLLFAPIAPTDMHPGADPFNTGDNTVDQLGGEFQFLSRIPAGGKGCSHEGAPVTFLRHDDFGQHRLVELHEVAASIAEVDQFIPQNSNDIIGHFRGVPISLAGECAHPH